jgi:hypothetical protein
MEFFYANALYVLFGISILGFLAWEIRMSMLDMCSVASSQGWFSMECFVSQIWNNLKRSFFPQKNKINRLSITYYIDIPADVISVKQV